MNLMSSVYHTTYFHKGVGAAAILLGNNSISGFPVQVAVGALLLSADEVEELVASSDDGILASTSEDSDGTRHPWQAGNMHFDCVPCFANISQPGGHLPLGQNHVGSLPNSKLFSERT